MTLRRVNLILFEPHELGAPLPHSDRRARHLLDVLESPRRQDRYVATAQLGVTLASLGLGMYGEHTLARLIEPWLGDLSFISAAAVASPNSLRTRCSCPL